MLCLGIETSCDETGLALAKDGEIIASVLASQASLHSLFGGVVPELASREHYRFIGPLFDQLMAKCGLAPGDLDIMAVARGPGLLGSLLVGVAFAKGLSLAFGKPLLGINHLHAHMLATGMENELEYPALGLLVSGGHTNIYRIESPSGFTCVGRTLDDAAGEAFDKIGKELGLPYPAGASIDQLAGKGRPLKNLLPRPYLDNDNLDFSFSGLKTAAVALIRDWFPVGAAPDSQRLKDFCASFNLAVADTLVSKVERALGRYPDSRSLWLAGGVAANSMARDKLRILACRAGIKFMAPAIRHCTDNAEMIAYSGCLLGMRGFRHDLALETIPRGRQVPEDMYRAYS